MNTLSAGVALLILLISFIPAILCLVLFFKVWTMTNDVREMRDMLRMILFDKNNNQNQNGK